MFNLWIRWVFHILLLNYSQPLMLLPYLYYLSSGLHDVCFRWVTVFFLIFIIFSIFKCPYGGSFFLSFAFFFLFYPFIDFSILEFCQEKTQTYLKWYLWWRQLTKSGKKMMRCLIIWWLFSPCCFHAHQNKVNSMFQYLWILHLLPVLLECKPTIWKHFYIAWAVFCCSAVYVTDLWRKSAIATSLLIALLSV